MQDEMLEVDASLRSLSPDAAIRGGDLPALRILLAAPRGFCAGVRRAIDAVVNALERHGPPVYVRRPIVHNLAVVRSLEAQGAVFVEELDQISPGAVVVLSAHGVAPAVAEEAERRGFTVYDAVCPLVAKVHREVVRHHRDGRHIFLIGHEGHPEIVGTLGHVPAGAVTVLSGPDGVAAIERDRSAPHAYAVQTTYSVDEADAVIGLLEERFDDLVAPPASDICYATTNRQKAIRAIAPRADAVIVAGEHFSSNACRLAEVAAAAGCPSVQLVQDASRIDWSRMPGSGGTVGITAAASTPEIIVTAILDALRERYALAVEEVAAADETTVFKPVRIG